MATQKFLIDVARQAKRYADATGDKPAQKVAQKLVASCGVMGAENQICRNSVDFEDGGPATEPRRQRHQRGQASVLCGQTFLRFGAWRSIVEIVTGTNSSPLVVVSHSLCSGEKEL